MSQGHHLLRSGTAAGSGGGQVATHRASTKTCSPSKRPPHMQTSYLESINPIEDARFAFAALKQSSAIFKQR